MNYVQILFQYYLHADWEWSYAGLNSVGGPIKCPLNPLEHTTAIGMEGFNLYIL